MAGLDWSSLRCYSSSGEASAPEDYHWLSALAGYKPVIEYCGGELSFEPAGHRIVKQQTTGEFECFLWLKGVRHETMLSANDQVEQRDDYEQCKTLSQCPRPGTEIGGGFLSGTLLQPQALSAFSTPTIGTRLALLAPDGHQSVHGRCTTSYESAVRFTLSCSSSVSCDLHPCWYAQRQHCTNRKYVSSALRRVAFVVCKGLTALMRATAHACSHMVARSQPRSSCGRAGAGATAAGLLADAAQPRPLGCILRGVHMCKSAAYMLALSQHRLYR